MRRAREVDAERASSAWSPSAIPIPATTPTTEATSPTTSASTTTEVEHLARGWRRAPAASASSRVRCATMIENVLKMMNAPTNSAIEREDQQRRPEEPEALLHASAFSSATVVPVIASTPSGSDRRDARAERRRLRRPSSAYDRDRVEVALRVEDLLRRLGVEDGERRAAEVVGVPEPHDARRS